MPAPPLARPRRRARRDEGPPPSWGERLAALKHVPPLLKLVFETHRGYTLAILVLRVVRSFIPVAVLWIGQLINDAVVARGGAGPARPCPAREQHAVLPRVQ